VIDTQHPFYLENALLPSYSLLQRSPCKAQAQAQALRATRYALRATRYALRATRKRNAQALRASATQGGVTAPYYVGLEKEEKQLEQARSIQHHPATQG